MNGLWLDGLAGRPIPVFGVGRCPVHECTYGGGSPCRACKARESLRADEAKARGRKWRMRYFLECLHQEQARILVQTTGFYAEEF